MSKWRDEAVHMKAVQEILGHSSFNTTANVYAHVLPAMKREAADKMDEVFAPVVSSLAPAPRPSASSKNAEIPMKGWTVEGRFR